MCVHSFPFSPTCLLAGLRSPFHPLNLACPFHISFRCINMDKWVLICTMGPKSVTVSRKSPKNLAHVESLYSSFLEELHWVVSWRTSSDDCQQNSLLNLA